MINKKAEQKIVLMHVGFILFVIVFFAGAFVSQTRASNVAVIYEQIYAKEIALAIDKAKPGTEFYVDISKLYDLAEKNKFKGRIVEIDNEENKVTVRAIFGEGYSFNFFSSVNVVWNIEEDGDLYLIIEKGDENEG